MRHLIDWFLTSKVAANLLMAMIIILGFLTLISSKLEVFPEISPSLINISVAYPGSTPEEVEEGVCIKLEEAITGLEGIKEISSIASENGGLVSAHLYDDADKQEVLDDIKSRIDSVSTLPEGSEEPVIIDVVAPQAVVSIVVSGQTDEKTLRTIAQGVRDEIASLSGISRVEITNGRQYEIAIEVSEEELRRYRLSFDEVAQALRGSALNLSAGSLKTSVNEILIRTNTQAYVKRDFEKIVVRRSKDGGEVFLKDVAAVVDGFEDDLEWSEFNGEPALTLTVFRLGDQGAPEIAEKVEDYLEKKKASLPQGIKLTLWKSWADLLDQRLDLMLRNGYMGLILVFLVLALFLKFRLAWWVALGIPTAFLGAIWLLPFFGTSINMMSLFGFIVVLGIMVDDAIVVSENIYHHAQAGEKGIEASRKGTYEVMLPVLLAVMTTIAAFMPMLTMPGVTGQFARVIPIVVVATLIFSLIESLLILPYHLSHGLNANKRKLRGPLGALQHFHNSFSKGLDWWIHRVYRPSLNFALRWSLLTLSAGVALVIFAYGLFAGGYVRFNFFPPVAGDQMVVSLTMPLGTPVEETASKVEEIRQAALELKHKYEKNKPDSVFKHMQLSIGSHPQTAEQNWDRGASVPASSNLGEIFIELQPPDVRGDLPAEDLLSELRNKVGDLPGVKEIRYDAAITGRNTPVNVKLRSSRVQDLRAAADQLQSKLRGFEGVFDIHDNMLKGKEELELLLKPEAESLGLTQAELTRQVRQAFYGEESQRIQRGKDEIKVMVRYPREARRSLQDIKDMMIQSPQGQKVPFTHVAEVRMGEGLAEINRSDGSRSINIIADVDRTKADANQINLELKNQILPELVAHYPGMSFDFDGEQQDQQESLGGLFRGTLIALALIYIFLALAFRSYLQPFVVMLAIPFGMVGAILGHWWLGHDITILSAIGILAMSGVVVNDSMILIDFVNRQRRAGIPILEAVKEAGPRRFRAILLTSLTTFAGLTPLLFETSVQAQFLIPMAISLSFGVMFSTFIILLVVPAAYILLDKTIKLLHKGIQFFQNIYA